MSGEVKVPVDLPSVCPVCGAYSLQHEHGLSILLAVCDVLVMKALEKMGNFIVRAERSRYHKIQGKPTHSAHTLWPATDAIVDKALKGAWDVVPYVLDTHGALLGKDPQHVTRILDQYVHDLAVTGNFHEMDELAYRLRTYLDLPVYFKTGSGSHTHQPS